jgi:hypothetical protein
MLSIRGTIVFAIVMAFVGTSCQDYGFEELPSSVIKEKRWTQTISIASEADILFVIDNSGSMVGEQRQLGESFGNFTAELDTFFGAKYHIAVITTGVESVGCPPCSTLPVENPSSCMNDTGESGRFQDNICHNDGTIDMPDYSCRTDPACPKVVVQSTKDCFYNTLTNEGMALTGINGCGYERGFSPIITALTSLRNSWNDGFLRDSATLVVVVITDEDDCGEVDDVTENLPGIGGNACYFAAKGVGPEGEFNDPEGKPYRLTPVEDYYNDLMEVKGNREGMVKFAAIVGVKDVNDLSTTTIEYTHDGSRWQVDDACTTPGCTGTFCFAEPGTRYIKMAQMFGIGKNGFVDTICQESFAETMTKLGTFVACPERFLLSEEILDPDLANILINGEAVPRFSCSVEGQLDECTGPGDSCPAGSECVETWTYCPPSGSANPACPPPSGDAPGGIIIFADHYDPCELAGDGEQVHIELVYVTP